MPVKTIYPKVPTSSVVALYCGLFPLFKHSFRRAQKAASDALSGWIVYQNPYRGSRWLRTLHSPVNGRNLGKSNRLFTNRSEQPPGTLPGCLSHRRLMGLPSIRRASHFCYFSLCFGPGPNIQLGSLDGGGASIVSSLADLASLSVNMFLLMATLRAMAEGRSTGLVTPEAGYDVICSTLDFAQASFGLVGTLFLATAAIKASGMARVAGWFLLIGLPISFLQVAEVGLHAPWTGIVDRWVTPVDEIIQHVVIGIALCAVLRRRLETRIPATGRRQPASSGSGPQCVLQRLQPIRHR